MFSSWRFLFASLLVVFAAGCGGSSDRPVERLVVLHFENLSADADADWAGVALAVLAADQLAGAETQHTWAVDPGSGAPGGFGTKIVDGYFDLSDGRILATAELRDTSSNRAEARWNWQAAYPDGIPELASKLAAAIGTPQRRVASSSTEALEAYCRSVRVESNEEKEELLREAIVADKDFLLPVIELGRLLALRGQTEEAQALLEGALAKAAGDNVLTTRLQYLIASLSGDQQAVVPALESYAEARPADLGLAEQTAAAYLSLHDYGKAAEWYGRAARIEPGRAELWNAQAYPQAYSGDFEGAVASLERYGEAAPDQPNVKDSLGEIYFRFGRFEEAERYFLETFDQDPEFQDSVALVKAARCRLMLGDLSGADETMARYVQRRSDLGDPGIEFRHAQWHFWSGRRAKAMEELREWAAVQDERPDFVALAHSQLALWSLLVGERDEAEQHAEAARQAEQSRAATGVALLAQFLTRPPADAEEWNRRVEELLPYPQQRALREELLLHAHLLAERFEEAGPLLEEIIAGKPPFGHDEFDVALGWLRLEAEDLAAAGQLLSPYPLVQPSNESPIYSFIFPKIFYLRGRLAAELGEREEAVRNLKMFLEYSGDVPLVFGDEAAAREMLAKLGT